MGALLLATMATGQATSDGLTVRAVAEVESRTLENGREVVKLVPADRLVPGDEVIYTLEIRNPGPLSIAAPRIVQPVPAHTLYLAGSASGPGAKVRYSVDGGHSFEESENLRTVAADGHMETAKCRDYTHIQWNLKNALKSHSVAFARFRAVVK